MHKYGIKQKNLVALTSKMTSYLQHNCKGIWEKMKVITCGCSKRFQVWSRGVGSLELPREEWLRFLQILLLRWWNAASFSRMPRGQTLPVWCVSSRGEASACLSPSLGDTVASCLNPPPPPPPHSRGFLSSRCVSQHKSHVWLSPRFFTSHPNRSGWVKMIFNISVCQAGAASSGLGCWGASWGKAHR